MKSRNAKSALAAIAAIVAVALLVIVFSNRGDAPELASSSPSGTNAANAPKDNEAPVDMIIKRDPTETEVAEMKYLPKNIELASNKSNAMLEDLGIRKGNRRLGRVRKLTDVELQGHFLAPRISPDGLQVLLTRPGYNGIYVMSINGGEPRLIANENAGRAKWTPDSKIEVIGEDGVRRVYGVDGILEESSPYDPLDQPAYAVDDTVFARPKGSDTAVPITGNDDRYFSPIISPDGKQVAYQGLYSGIYVAPLDGSSEPRFIGEGNNFSWTPGSDGLVYDVTSDDGHYLTEGDIYMMDLRSSERSNLTEGDNLISQLPSLGPDGRSVAFEADGGIYIGTLQ